MLIESFSMFCVTNPQLAGFSNLSVAPTFLENQEGRFACSCPHINHAF